MDSITHLLILLQGAWRLAEVLIIFGILVIGHEFGHFIMAKLSGMRVDEFAIGFGKKLFSWKKGETLYSVNLVPLGGYNKIYGMDLEETEADKEKEIESKEEKPAEDLTGKKKAKAKIVPPDYSLARPDDPRAFVNRPLYQRFAVVVAGSLMNLIIAVIVVFLMGISLGFPAAELGGVIPEGPADIAGLQPGDIITHLDGARLSSTSDLQRIVAYSDGKPVQIKGVRGGTEFTASVTPMPTRLVDSHFCRLGFAYLNDGTIIYPVPKSPADRAGLLVGDIVLSVDGIRFPSSQLSLEGGNGIANFEIYRNFVRKNISVDYFDSEFNHDTYSPFGFLADQDQVITKVVPKDIAAEAGLQAGDRIVSSSENMWATPTSDLTEAPRTLEVTYERGGTTHHARLEPDESFSRIQVYMDDASLPILSNLSLNHPLYLAGLRSGDRIISVGGEDTANGISTFIMFERHLGETVKIVAMSKDQEKITSVVVPAESDKQKARAFLAGLHFKTRYFRADPVTSMVAGVRKTGDIMSLIFKTLQYLATGRASVNDLAGPVGIATVTYQAASSGLVDLINIMVLLSVNLGIFNLLPLPALDGGRLFFMIAEGILRRPVVNVRVENIIHMAGFLLLLLFALFVTYHDIARLIFNQ